MLYKFSFFTKDSGLADTLKRYMKENLIQYEPSACYDGIYFAIRCLRETADELDTVIDNYRRSQHAVA